VTAKNSFFDGFVERGSLHGPTASPPRRPERFAGDREAAGANLDGMLAILEAVVGALFAALRPRASLVAENLVLRQQLAILRRVLHVNVTTHPYAAWAAQQIVEAIGAEIVPAPLIRDGDAIFGAAFDARVDNLGVRQIRISPRSPWQSGYAERWVGTLRRDLLDHLILLGDRHLLRLVREYVAYYNEDRPHMSLDRDAPVARAVQPPSRGRVVAPPRVGGLHHRYSRAA
jgi:transposase InsO family protein